MSASTFSSAHLSRSQVKESKERGFVFTDGDAIGNNVLALLAQSALFPEAKQHELHCLLLDLWTPVQCSV